MLRLGTPLVRVVLLARAREEEREREDHEQDVEHDHHPARELLVVDRAQPQRPLAAAVDVGVDRRADEDEAHPQEHAEEARGQDVPDLPQLAAQPAPLGLEHRPPDEHADGDEGGVLERVHERVAHRRVEEDREVPAVEHEHVDRQRHQRAAQEDALSVARR